MISRKTSKDDMIWDTVLRNILTTLFNLPPVFKKLARGPLNNEGDTFINAFEAATTLIFFYQTTISDDKGD